MSLKSIPSENKSFLARHFINFVRKIIKNSPSYEDIKDIGKLFRLEDQDSFWAEINSHLKLYRFTAKIKSDDYEFNQISDFDRFRPILLIHGYQSNHVSWDWMTQKLWNDGFRHIYAMELKDFRKGFDHNMEQLVDVVQYLLSVQINYNKIDIIAHSMGGIVARQFLKLHQGALYIRLFISLGSPYKGVFKVWGRLARLDDAHQSAKDFNDLKKLKQINEAEYYETFYKLTQINIIGVMKRYLNTDGLFKNHPLNDMMNFTVGSTHFQLNKNVEIYNIIKDVLWYKNWYYKLRLLSIHRLNISGDENPRQFDLMLSLRFVFTDLNTNKILGHYPTKDLDELIFDINKPFIPTSPIISFSSSVKMENKANLGISVLYNNKRIITKELVFNYEKTSENVDYVSLETKVSSSNINIAINFAITKYVLD